MLNWHRSHDGRVRACASRLYMEDTLPPMYTLVQIKTRKPPREVRLVRKGVVTTVGEAPSLADAKQLAQDHYDDELTKEKKA